MKKIIAITIGLLSLCTSANAQEYSGIYRMSIMLGQKMGMLYCEAIDYAEAQNLVEATNYVLAEISYQDEDLLKLLFKNPENKELEKAMYSYMSKSIYESGCQQKFEKLQAKQRKSRH